MVIHDFHAWLIGNGHDALVIVSEGTALHKGLIDAGYADSTFAYSKDVRASAVRRMMHDKLDSPDAAILFHRHRAIRTLFWRRFKAKTSMLSHTFYKSKKRDLWHRYLFSKIDRWIALTPLHLKNMNEMLGVNPSRITIIPNGVNIKKFKPVELANRSPNEFHIGIVARLDPQKGQDIAIEALAELSSKTSQKLFLHFFGDETPGEASIRPMLKSLAQKRGVESQVIFEGFKPQVHECLPQMDLLWLPSHRETFGRCLIEGMACGVPVVASDAGGVPDIIEHQVNGMLFETKNPQDLAKQTLVVINDEKLRVSIRDKALADVRAHYDIDQIFSRLLHAILPAHVQNQKVVSEQSKKRELEKPLFVPHEASFENSPS